MKKLLLALALCLVSSVAFAQCNGVFPIYTGCGNNTGTAAPPKPFSLATISGSVTAKLPAQLATTANITLSGEQTIDGVLTSASRVLVKNQSTVSQNGCYVTSGGAWARCTDFNATGQVVRGTSIYITQGTLNRRTTWNITSADPITIGSTGITLTSTATIIDYPFVIRGSSVSTTEPSDLYMHAGADAKDANGAGVYREHQPIIELGYNRLNDYDKTANLYIERFGDTATLGGTPPYVFNSAGFSLFARNTWPFVNTDVSSTNAVVTVGGSSAGNHANQDTMILSSSGFGSVGLENQCYGGMITCLYVVSNNGSHAGVDDAISPKYLVDFQAGTAVNDSVGFRLLHYGVPASGDLFEVSSDPANPYPLFQLVGPLNAAGGSVTAGGLHADLNLSGNIISNGGSNFTLDPLTGDHNTGIHLIARSSGVAKDTIIYATQNGAIYLQNVAASPGVSIGSTPSAPPTDGVYVQGASTLNGAVTANSTVLVTGAITSQSNVMNLGATSGSSNAGVAMTARAAGVAQTSYVQATQGGGIWLQPTVAGNGVTIGNNGTAAGTDGLYVQGGIQAAGLSTSTGSITGSLCATAGGVIIYKVGANCF